MDHDQESPFESATATPGKLGSWLDSVSNDELKKVGQLTCYWEGVGSGTIPVSGTLGGHYDSLQQLTHITLSHCGVSTGELVALIDRLPNLNYINLKYPLPLDGSNQQISLSHQHPLERLHITNGCSKFLDKLPEAQLHFNEIIFENNQAALSADYVNHVLCAVGAGAKTLRLPFVNTSMCNL